jgi:hypothetical protein
MKQAVPGIFLLVVCANAAASADSYARTSARPSWCPVVFLRMPS